MVKLFSLQVLYKSEGDGGAVKHLAIAHNLTSFGFFERSTIREFLEFTGKLIVERSQRCTRSKVQEQAYLCHCYIRGDLLSAICVSDDDYPPRVAQSLLSRLLDEFETAYPASQWGQLELSRVSFKKAEEHLVRFQDPKQADSMLKLQGEIDETKGILTNTMESLLQRGEKLDDLVARSDALSQQSKAFYQTAKKTNRCCVLL